MLEHWPCTGLVRFPAMAQEIFQLCFIIVAAFMSYDGDLSGIGLYFFLLKRPSVMMTSLNRGSVIGQHSHLRYLHILDFA